MGCYRFVRELHVFAATSDVSFHSNVAMVSSTVASWAEAFTDSLPDQLLHMFCFISCGVLSRSFQLLGEKDREGHGTPGNVHKTNPMHSGEPRAQSSRECCAWTVGLLGWLRVGGFPTILFLFKALVTTSGNHSVCVCVFVCVCVCVQTNVGRVQCAKPTSVISTDPPAPRCPHPRLDFTLCQTCVHT